MIENKLVEFKKQLILHQKCHFDGYRVYFNPNYCSGKYKSLNNKSETYKI